MLSPLNKPLCIGHRGARGHIPENTLPSFAWAIDQGCDWIELDVYRLDGELVVIHDQTVDRTTNGSGELTDYSLASLRQLDAGNGARIPLLKEVIDLVDHRCGINVELKGKATAEPVSALLSSYCRQGWATRDFLLSSFDHAELALSDPTFPRGALFHKVPDDPWPQAQALHAWSVNFDVKDISPDLVNQAHELGYRVLTYTVNEEAEIRRVLDCGVDGVFSDYPERVLRIRG